MPEKKLYAVPADWPQPAFVLGETVYYLEDKEYGLTPFPGQVIGLLFHAEESAEEKKWGYVVAWEGYSPIECREEYLTREAWEVSVDGGPDIDPFLGEVPYR